MQKAAEPFSDPGLRMWAPGAGRGLVGGGGPARGTRESWLESWVTLPLVELLRPMESGSSVALEEGGS